VYVLQPRPRTGLPDWIFLLEEAVALAQSVDGWRCVHKEGMRLARPSRSKSRSRAPFPRGPLAGLAQLIHTGKHPLDEPEQEDEGDESGRYEEEDLLEDLFFDDDEGEDEREDGRRSEKRPAAALARPAFVFVNIEMLRPRERRALQEILGVPVFDRFMVVLQIFKSRARSPEAKLRLALAENARLRTMLVDAVASHAQQRGGTGKLSGPGEKQIQLRRSVLQKQANALQAKLDALPSRGARLLQQRERSANAGRLVPAIALVGYTNAGKSLLHARLCGAAGDSSRARDAMFASLDTCTRGARLPDGSEATVVDTVGFVRDLSHKLVQCFHATLQEALHCDLLLVVVDASSPHAALERSVVLGTLASLRVPQAVLDRRIELYNKVDLLDEAGRQRCLHWAQRELETNSQHRAKAAERSKGGEGGGGGGGPVVMMASALTGEGCDELTSEIASRLAMRMGRVRRTLTLPCESGVAGRQLSFLHGHPRASVVHVEVSDDGSSMQATVDIDADTYAAFTGTMHPGCHWQQTPGPDGRQKDKRKRRRERS